MRLALALLPILERARRYSHEQGHLTLGQSEFCPGGGDTCSVIGGLRFPKGFGVDHAADKAAFAVWNNLRDAPKASGAGEKSRFAADDFFETSGFHSFNF